MASPFETGATQMSSWEQMVQETLRSPEYEPGSFDVYPLVGRIATGKKTIRGLLTEWLQRDGYVVEFASTGARLRQHQQESTGRRKMLGHYQRDPQVDKQLDLETARWMIDPDNKGKILIPAGRLLGYSTKRLKDISANLGLQLPGNLHPILLEADEQVRMQREYEILHEDDPTLTREQSDRLMLDRERGEDITFKTIYPDLMKTDWYDPNMVDERNNRIFELSPIDTSEHSAGFSARKIYEYIKATTVVEPIR